MVRLLSVNTVFMMRLEMLKRLLFFFSEPLLPFQKSVPIYKMAVEFRPINTDELRLPSDGNTARAAHPGGIDHVGIERYQCL